VAHSRLEVDLSAIDRNLAAIRAITSPPSTLPTPAQGKPQGVGICAVLKQDAYGCGAARVAKRLAASGADAIAVYSLDEARAVAEAVPTIPILVLMPVSGLDRSDPLYRHAAGGRIHLVLHGPDQLAAITETAARIGAALPLHVQIDTGLSRGGVMPEQARPLVETIVKSQKLRLAGLMTHFSAPCCDDAFTREQARMFRDFVQDVAPILKASLAQGSKGASRLDQMALHAANSCATFRSRAYHGTMVRVGQSLLGYGCEEVGENQSFEFRGAFDQLEPAVRWIAPIVHLQEIPAGWPVGYGGTWKAPLRPDGRKTKIALIPVGYADGYPRPLGGKGNDGPGMVGFTARTFERRGSGESEDAGRATTDSGAMLPTVYAPVVGRVSMDQITIDVTDVPEQYLKFTKVNTDWVGPEVELLGRVRGAPNFLPSMAHAAGSITHETLTRISPKVERIHRFAAGESGPVRLPAHGRLTGIGGASAVAQ